MALYNDYIEVFDSVDAFASTIETRPQNRTMTGKASETSSEYFAGTKDYKTASELLKNGDSANLDKLQTVNIKSLPVSNELKNTLCKSVCGGVPLVPLALIGVPKNMLATRKTAKTAKVVNIIYNPNFHSGIAADDIIKAGAKVASLVKALELRKVRVNLFACLCSKGDFGQMVAALVNIKKAAAPFNMLRIAYPLINPSFLRRHYFKFIETCPAALTRRYNSTYGGVLYLSDEKVCELIKSKIKGDLIMIDGEDLITADINNKVEDYFAK